MNYKQPPFNKSKYFDSSAGEQLSTDCESLTKQLPKGRQNGDPFYLPENLPQSARGADGNKTCDISRKCARPKKPAQNPTLSRSILYNLRFKAGDIIGGRTARCGCVAGFNDQREIAIMQTDQNFYLSGVETCGSVWSCPVCALKISQKRADQVREILTWSQTRSGVAHGFLTLTTRHTREEKCKAVKKRVLDAWRKVTQSRKFKDFGAESIRALEVKYSYTNGWHPHLHIALIAEKSSEELKQFVYGHIIPTYLRIIGTDTTAANQKYKPIYGGTGVSDYITKWDLSLELTHSSAKEDQSGSITPFGMLKELNKPDPEYTTANAEALTNRILLEHVYREYCEAFKGSKQLTVSRKLKNKFCEIDLLTDEEIANESQAAAEEIVKIERALFSEIASIRAQADVINAVQDGGIALAQLTLMELGVNCEYDEENNILKSKTVFRGWGPLTVNYDFYRAIPAKQEKFKLDFE